ncbi:hypothetical protein L6259_02535, partial [Candidatus Parcubacteria bacterium]|nr:hypothetical protein [Candidatus Parcubacteria bacterium]
MEKPKIEELSKERTKILQEVVDRGKKEKREERVKILREALDKEPEEQVIELEPEEPGVGEGMPEELKEKLKTLEENATEAEVVVEEKIAGHQKEGAKRAEKLQKAAESAKKLEPKLKKMRDEILFGKKGEAGTVAEIRKNLEASEAEWDRIGEDLDWRAREEEARKLLGEEGIKRIQEIKEGIEGTDEKSEPSLESQEEVSGGWSDAGGAEGGEEDLSGLFKKDEPEEVFELKKKKPSSVEVAEGKVKLEQKQEKLSLTELDDRVNALWKAMDEVLQDAAQYNPSKMDKKAMQTWARKQGGIESWPLDDKITKENYKERLAKYGVADFIDPLKIEPHNDAYAVVSKQYKKYREELENRIKKVKLRQLEKLEEDEEPKKQASGLEAPVRREIKKPKKQEDFEQEKPILLRKKKTKTEEEPEEIETTDDMIEETIDLDDPEPKEETLGEKEDAIIEKGRKKIKKEFSERTDERGRKAVDLPESEYNIKTSVIKKPKKKKGFFGWFS